MLVEFEVIDANAGRASGEVDHRPDGRCGLAALGPLPHFLALIAEQIGGGPEQAARNALRHLLDEGSAGVDVPDAIAVDDPHRPGLYVADAAVGECDEPVGVAEVGCTVTI